MEHPEVHSNAFGARLMTYDIAPTTRADQPDSLELWASLKRPLPQWFARARFGIFIHWGPYSVPAWAEPTGALGVVPATEWFPHNPYAEWYYNTIRIPGSPAAEHHRQIYDGAPYDDFLDAWTASAFDPHDWARLFADAGAEYVIPTSKHHDGVALWDAPGTGTRNTIYRGPRRDLISEIASAVRAEGLRFGVYYSGGLDWSITNLPPITLAADLRALRPVDAAYNTYAYLHVQDLITRYAPDVLWNDIDWPDAGKRGGRYSLHALLEHYYRAVPDGVVNDRWGETHWDFRTSEYEASRENEQAGPWENCRGIGFSFGYNQTEHEDQSLSGYQLATYLTDVVSRGGRLLLNVGPTAEGLIPPVQRQALEDLCRWMAKVAPILRASSPVPPQEAPPSEEPWVRWLATADHVVAVVAAEGVVNLQLAHRSLDMAGTQFLAGQGIIEEAGGQLRVELTPPQDGPTVLLIPRR
jgi:alpha-L-fucosidase